MAASELREATDRREMFGGKRLVSMLDMIGGGTATCARCGRWQYFAAISRREAQKYLSGFGWTFAGYSDAPSIPCPTCGHRDDTNDWRGVDVCPLCSKVEPAQTADAVGLSSDQPVADTAR